MTEYQVSITHGIAALLLTGQAEFEFAFCGFWLRYHGIGSTVTIYILLEYWDQA